MTKPAAASFPIQAGAVFRLGDADGYTCGASPKGVSLVVASVDDSSGASVITFNTDIVTGDAGAATKCVLIKGPQAYVEPDRPGTPVCPGWGNFLDIAKESESWSFTELTGVYTHPSSCVVDENGYSVGGVMTTYEDITEEETNGVIIIDTTEALGPQKRAVASFEFEHEDVAIALAG